jgi:hypothetical protein
MENQIKGVSGEALAEEVFERLKPELMALKTEELFQVNLDISAAFATVLGVLPEVRGLRGQIEKELPSFDLVQFDKLEDYALALSGAQANYLAATSPPDDLDALTEESSRVREMLLAEARSLVHRGLVSTAQLEELKGAKGYKNVATDLMVLTKVLRDVWEQIQGKTPTTTQDLDTASRLATRLFRVVGLREQSPARVAEATELRMRAYTKLLICYEDARRAVAYLRGAAGDADSYAPALHPGRPRRRAKEEAEAATPPAAGGTNAPTTGAPVATPGAAAGTAPAANAATSSSGPFVS